MSWKVGGLIRRCGMAGHSVVLHSNKPDYMDNTRFKTHVLWVYVPEDSLARTQYWDYH